MRKTQTFARKRKTILNLLLAALCLLLAWSRAGFPPWTLDGLLRRAEQQYLLEDSQLLSTGHEEGKSDFWKGTLYVQSGCLLYTSPSPRDRG